MNNTITICMPYYENPIMLAKQIEIWNGYPDEAKAVLKFIVVDDGSPEPAPINLQTNVNIEMYRIKENIHWNIGGARNLAATQAKTEYVFFLDIDHTLRPEYVLPLLINKYEPKTINTFKRYRLYTEEPLKISERPSSADHILINKDEFFGVGGYDEDFSGRYGCEGGWLFRQALALGFKRVIWDNVALYAYLGGDANANLPRDKKPNQVIFRKKEAGSWPTNPARLRFDWEKVR